MLAVRNWGIAYDIYEIFKVVSQVTDQSDLQAIMNTVKTWGMSVRAAAAGIIAANFSAVHTDSPLQRSRWQRLPAAAQRF